MNIHYFSSLLFHIEAWAEQGGYFFLIIMSVLEGIPLLGTVVPGHTAIIAGGFLARLGVLNIWTVMIISAIGAMTGDMIGFYFGRRYGMGPLERFARYFSVREEHIDKAKRLIGAHTGKALIVGRFNPLARSLMPFVIGASRVPAGRFWLFNVIGGVSWATLSVLLGYVFGIGYHAAAGYFGKAVVIAVIAGLVAIWGYRFINMRFHIFRKYELIVLALNILALWGLVETIQDAWAVNSFMANFDVWVNSFMAAHATPLIAKISSVVTNLGNSVLIGVLTLAVGGWFLWRRKWRSAAIMFISVLSAGALVGLLKSFFVRARPDNAIYQIFNDPSFPSGHATMSAVFFATLVYLLAPKFRTWISREIFIVICVLLVFAIGVSRLVLNVHWASDVIAGWSLGIWCATATILLVRYLGALLVPRARV